MSGHRLSRSRDGEQLQLTLPFDDAPRSKRMGRRRALIIAASLLPGVGLIGGVAVASLNESASGPVKSLQAVNVTLGPDGSTTNIGMTTLSAANGKTTSTTSVLDPRATAAKLPVRVAVSYVSGNKSGTDLRQFTGATGPVEMDVTVTNNTVHPEAFTANYAASNGSTYALVATPMTVVATATLPKASVLSVTTPATAADTPHTTNGIIGRDTAGNTTVQWTALLAPPRLAPSSTFRLVVDASKFALGGLNISVEPGLQTDPSVAHLLNTALGAGQVSQVDGQTVTLVTNIDSTLQETSRTLDLLRSRLSKTAGTEGTNATQLLTSASGDLTQSSKTLTSDINALKANVKGSLDQGTTGSRDDPQHLGEQGHRLFRPAADRRRACPALRRVIHPRQPPAARGALQPPARLLRTCSRNSVRPHRRCIRSRPTDQDASRLR